MEHTTSHARHTEAPWFEGGARGVDADSGLGRRCDDGLRSAVGAVERQMSLLPALGTTEVSAATVGELRSSWAALLERLDLGPAPDVRSCPVCGHQGMSAATLCGYCWTRLSPIVRSAPLVSG